MRGVDDGAVPGQLFSCKGSEHLPGGVAAAHGQNEAAPCSDRAAGLPGTQQKVDSLARGIDGPVEIIPLDTQDCPTPAVSASVSRAHRNVVSSCKVCVSPNAARSPCSASMAALGWGGAAAKSSAKRDNPNLAPWAFCTSYAPSEYSSSRSPGASRRVSWQ